MNDIFSFTILEVRLDRVEAMGRKESREADNAGEYSCIKTEKGCGGICTVTGIGAIDGLDNRKLKGLEMERKNKRL